MIYTSQQLYGTNNLSILKGEIPYLEERIKMMEKAKTAENSKHHSVRNSHLIKKINDSQDFWRKRIKEIEGSGMSIKLLICRILLATGVIAYVGGIVVLIATAFAICVGD